MNRSEKVFREQTEARPAEYKKGTNYIAFINGVFNMATKIYSLRLQSAKS